MNELKYLQWNGRSVLANKGFLERFLYENKINIAFLSETWFKPRSLITFQGYNLIRNDREDGKGGVAILIKKNIAFSINKISNNIPNVMVVAATLHLSNKNNLNIYSVYVKPQSQIRSSQWETFFNELKKPFIVAGDFNMHHYAWGCSWTDNEGRNLLAAMNECDISFLNNGSETLVKKINQTNNSAVDLTLCNSEIAANFQWDVNNNTMGSDHYAIMFSNSYDKDYIVKNQHDNWNVNKADWTLFSNLVENYATNLLDSDINYEDFLYNLNLINERSIPKKKKEFNKKFSKIWWNSQCQSAINEQREALKKYKENSNFENYLNFKRISAITKKTIIVSKRNSWKKFCNNLNRNTNINEIWSQIKKIKNCFREQTSPLIDGDWLEIFINTLTPLIPSEQIEQPSSCNLEHELTKKFTMNELIRCLNNKNTAPGMDKIHYPMLLNLPEIGKQMLLQIYNNIFTSGQIPKDWKKYLVLPILKHQKDPKLAKSYRAISLASCLLKIYERLLKNRLESWLEINKKIPEHQYGFRKNCSTYDNLSHLISDINYSFTNNKALISVFIDIEGAYDNIHLKTLYRKMISMDIPEKFAFNVIHLYINREIYVKINNDIKGPRLSNIGLPQGGILSPLLYILYTCDLEKSITNQTKIIQYADDICIYIENCELNEGVEKLNEAIIQLHQWTFENGLTINTAKTQLCIFSRKRSISIAKIKLNNSEYEVKDTISFLGVTLDRKLLWKKHIESIITKCEKANNILKSVTHTSWGADPNISLLIYKSFIRSIIDYGAIFYDQSAKSHLEKIDKIQNQSLRLCLGVMRSSPIHCILAETQVTPLSHRRKILGTKYLLKLYSKQSEIINKIHNLYILDLSHKYWEKKKNMLLVECYGNIIGYNNIYKFDVLPTFMIEYEITPQTYYFKNYEQLPANIVNKLFTAELKLNYSNAYCIYTDGSKTLEATACAFYDPQETKGFTFKLAQEISIYNAELIAILESLKYIQNVKDTKNFLILTDSKSSVDTITNILHNPKVNYIIVNIINNIRSLQIKGKKITISWIKGHSGLQNNEIVDQMAKTALEEQSTANYMIPSEDIFVKLKRDILNDWQDTYYRDNKGKYYKDININPNSRPWYSKYEYSSKCFIRTLCRLRINHGLFPYHLHKIKLSETPNCSCGEIGTAQHLILECTEKQNSINCLLNKIYKLNIHTPVNLQNLLTESNYKVYLAIYEYISKEKIKI